MPKEQKIEKKVSWWHAQLLNIRAFAEIIIVLLLDALLIISVWGLRKFVIWAVGVDPSAIQDSVLFWLVRLSEFSTIIILALYVISDVIRHLFKAYIEIKNNFRVVLPNPVRAQR